MVLDYSAFQNALNNGGLTPLGYQPGGAVSTGGKAGNEFGIAPSILNGTSNLFPSGGGGGTQPQSGQVLGAATSTPSAPSAPSGPDYSSFYSQLDQMLGDLGVQSGALQTQAQEQTNQQQNTLDLQKTQGEQQLNQYQNKSLKDIGSTIASGFRAGNVLLGSMGAGDSSAANQYAYALAKEGSKQRGNVMADVSARMGGLQQVYNTAKNNLVSGLNQKIGEIAQWFSSQQMSLRGQKAEVAKQQSDQALQIAMNALSTAQNQAMGIQNALNTWVANNATSIQSAQQQIQQNVANNPVPGTINTTPQSTVASAAPTFWSNNNDTTKNTLFG